MILGALEEGLVRCLYYYRCLSISYQIWCHALTKLLTDPIFYNILIYRELYAVTMDLLELEAWAMTVLSFLEQPRKPQTQSSKIKLSVVDFFKLLRLEKPL